jgi:hypothetical protein
MAMTALKSLATFVNAKGQGSSLGGKYDGRDLQAGMPASKALRDFADELKFLSHEEKEELGKLAADALGEEFTPTAPKA